MQPIDSGLFLKTLKRRNLWAIGLGVALCLPIPAEAQYYGRGWGGYGGGPYAPYGGYGGPYDDGPYADYDPDMGPRYRGGPSYDGSAPAYRRPNQANEASQPGKSNIISAELIERKIKAAGFRLVAAPRHKGDIYLAEVEDKNAVRRRLVYDAHDGHLLENTSLGPVKKLNPQSDDEKPSKPTKPDRSGRATEPTSSGQQA
jgi:hypothetical protein